MDASHHVSARGSEIFLNPKGWIDVRWGAHIDKDEYVDIGGWMYTLMTHLQDNGTPPLMLIDFSRLEGITPEAAALASQATKGLECRKIAGYGIRPQSQGVLDGIKARSTREGSIKEFADRDEAEAWLLET